MSQEVRNLEPKALWNHFADLNSVPRPSKKEERVIAFMKEFGESLNLPTLVDEVGNVIIKKPASPGNENKTTIVLQSHLDMVHQKNSDTNFDFLTPCLMIFPIDFLDILRHLNKFSIDVIYFLDKEEEHSGKFFIRNVICKKN